jgi:hypothetical protein
MRRFSIRFLMAFVLVSAVGLAALRNANELWEGTMLLLALAAVGMAILGAIFMRGRDRAWWIGFALFSGGYLLMTFAPGLSNEVRPKLGTTHLLDEVHHRLTPLVSQDSTREQWFVFREWERNLPALQSVGHSLFALVAGLVGGMIAVWFHGRRERAETAVV